MGKLVIKKIQHYYQFHLNYFFIILGGKYYPHYKSSSEYMIPQTTLTTVWYLLPSDQGFLVTHLCHVQVIPLNNFKIYPLRHETHPGAKYSLVLLLHS